MWNTSLYVLTVIVENPEVVTIIVVHISADGGAGLRMWRVAVNVNETA
jgi:hypothetical protein